MRRKAKGDISNDQTEDTLALRSRTEIAANLLCLAHDDEANDISDFMAARAEVFGREDCEFSYPQ